MKVQNEVASFLQNQDFEGLGEYFDEKNGDDIGIKITRTEAGGVKIVETKDGKDVNTILDAADQATALENMQALSSFGNTASYAELLFKREKGDAEKDKLVAETGSIKTSTEYQKILNDSAKLSEELKNSNMEARTKLANAQTEKLKQEVQQEKGLTWNKKQGIKAYGAWISSSGYQDLVLNLEDEPEMLLNFQNRIKLGLGVMEKPPAGIETEDWLKLEDVERAEILAAG